MTDLQLPHPLLDPAMWPGGEALFSIFHLKYGGAFTTRNARKFAVPEHFWLREASLEPSLIVVIREAFADFSAVEIVSKHALDRTEQAEWRKVGATSFRVDSSLKSPTLMEWSREVFPEAFREAGEVHWLRELRDYEEQLGAVSPSLDQLRFWPAFLRTRKMFFSQTASREWANAQALFSAQDDSRGDGTDAVLNPTLQVVTDDKKMRAIWRIDGALTQAELSWEQAAVFDELRETPRMNLLKLLTALESREFALKAKTPFVTVVQNMVHDGMILLRS